MNRGGRRREASLGNVIRFERPKKSKNELVPKRMKQTSGGGTINLIPSQIRLKHPMRRVTSKERRGSDETGKGRPLTIPSKGRGDWKKSEGGTQK